MSRFIGIAILTIGFFSSAVVFAQSGEIEIGRQKIRVLQDQLAEMIAQNVATLSDADVAAQRNLFLEKVQELDLLRARYQALVVTTGVTKETKAVVDDEDSEADVEVRSEKNKALWTNDIPKSMNDFYRFLQQDPAHAFSALQNFSRIRGAPKGGDRNLDRVGSDLVKALQQGVERGSFSTMPSLLALLNVHSHYFSWMFERAAIDNVDIMTDVYHIGVPLLVEFNDTMENAIISWIKTRPSTQDIRGFLSASKKAPLEWIGGSFEGFAPERGERIFAAILDSGWGQNPSDVFELIALSKNRMDVDNKWLAQNINKVSSSFEIDQLLSTSQFMGRVLILESILRRDLQDSRFIVSLLFKLNSDLNSDRREIERMKEEGLRDEAEIATRIYNERRSWLRWVATSYQNNFRDLNPSKDDLSNYQEYADIKLSRRATKLFSAAGPRPESLYPLQDFGGSGLKCQAVFRP